MENCPLCGGRVDSLGNALQDEIPIVGSQQPGSSAAHVCPPEETAVEDSIPDGQPVARFTGAAEAGFFAAELEHVAGIPAAVHISESFDAVIGNWQPSFVLLVSPQLAEEATRLVHEWASQTDHTEEAAFDQSVANVGQVGGKLRRRGRSDRAWSEFDPAGDNRPGETFTLEDNMSWSVPWLPLLLTLTAGSLTVWTVRKLNRPPVRVAPARPAEEVLQEQIQQRAVLTGVWTRERPQLQLQLHETDPPIDLLPDGNSPVISIQTDRRGTVIRSDFDGDGRFDEEFVFPFKER